MLTLLSELRFWSTKEDITVKDTDLGATKYFEKKSENVKSIYAEGKKHYFEARGCKWNVDNKKPIRLRNALKLLEDELRQRRIVYCKWKNNVLLQIMLSNGLLVHLVISPFTGDINRIYFDKYFIGKLNSELITDVIITQTHILISYHENQITFVHLQKPTARKNNLEKISLMEPKIYNVIIGGPTTRKIPKHLVCSSSQEFVIVWTKSSQNEVYPWRPTVKDQDRANLHVYKLNGAKMELLCYYWTEYDPILVDFSLLNGFQVHSVEQKVSKKGDVTIDSCIYQIHKSKMRRVAVTSIPLQTQVCCNAFSPDHEKLMLGCIDGSVVLFDEGRGITHLVKAAFIPTFVSWHSDSSVVMIGNEKGQLQCFDIALSCVRTQLMSEDIVPSSILDLSNYFIHPSNLARLCWSRKPEITEHNERYAVTDSFLLLALENGPIGCLRFVGGAGLKGDVHTSGLTADVLIHKYISLNQVEKAINILLSLNWDTYGAMCLLSLHRIANYIFKQPLGMERELQLQKALGSFLVPVKPLCFETEVEFGDQVNDVTLRFFHYLLRSKSFNKAFSLAIDINDADLFLKLHDKAKAEGDAELAKEALRKVDDINRICTNDRSDSEHSLCSNSSCSLCADSFDDENDDEGDEDSHESGRESVQPQLPVRTSSKLPNQDAVSFKSYSTSSSSSKSSQIRNGTLQHPPLPKTSMPESNSGGTSVITRMSTSKIRTKSEFSHADRPPLPYVPKKAPTTVMQRSQTAMALKLNKQQQSRIAQIRLKGKSLSSSNLLSITDNTSPYFGTSMQRGNVRARLNPREKAASKLFTSAVASLSMEQLDISNRSPRQPFYVDFVDNPASSRPNPSAAGSSQHVVIDVIPKPVNPPNSMNYPPTTNILDQTIGIPIVQDEPDFARRPRKAWFTSQPSQQFRSIPNTANANNAPRTVIHQYPLISGNIPSKFPQSKSQSLDVTDRGRFLQRRKEPSASILSNSTNSSGSAQAGPSTSGYSQQPGSSSSSSSAKKESGERNKVKFSDTVTVAVVPEIPRKDKMLLGDKARKPVTYNSLIADPRRELAESLPLCHPNDDYLKDFTPMQDVITNNNEQQENNEDAKKIPNIKVVHFGVV
ncbi:WD repeat-containing and planar cell polarity effector protein fritz [Uranotaenia lowii]|uniref:WD repeat-containing and planar cell polarity effector protein fritz n=1 Tax=Uranotaenia lowii TaxID=190385 RepID=UPI002478F60C|nr:WD repeat-containing and planar cell polarity effector protein fritz [Uranotaenia lowii]